MRDVKGRSGPSSRRHGHSGPPRAALRGLGFRVVRAAGLRTFRLKIAWVQGLGCFI